MTIGYNQPNMNNSSSDTEEELSLVDLEEPHPVRLNRKENCEEALCSNKCKRVTCFMTFIALMYLFYIWYSYEKMSDNERFDENPHYSGRRILRMIGHPHHSDTCIERDEKGETPCCYEDLRCWGKHFSPIQLSRGVNMHNYSKLRYEDESGNYCNNYKNFMIEKMVSDYNRYMGNESFVSIKYNKYDEQYVVNTAKCNDLPYGCCQIEKSCDEKIWILGTPKISENDNRCPDIKDLMYWENVDYPEERYEDDIAFFQLLTVCALFWVCCSAR